MKFASALFAALSLHGAVLAHPEKHERGVMPSSHLVTRSSNKCAAAIEARKEATRAKRAQRLIQRRIENGATNLPRDADMSSMEKRNKYSTIQNTTCVLAPDTIFGPYGIDGEMERHDLRETQEGVDFYFDIGLIDIETCEPLENAAIGIWNCNATGTYSSYTGIDPDTSELMDGWSSRTDGTTDDETFLRGIQITDSEGMIEFLTKFPGYYVTRTTHIHVTVQTDIKNGTSYSSSAVQHVGQLFFEEDLLNEVYAVAPYAAHLSTLNRTTNSEDKLFSSASADGYSAVISVEKLGDGLDDGLVGYITIGVNKSAEAIAVTGESVNPQGYLPTVSIAESKKAQATAADIAAGYTD